nr:hypothetical protein Iba_chr06aCG12130 [Ipomoea batatas]
MEKFCDSQLRSEIPSYPFRIKSSLIFPCMLVYPRRHWFGEEVAGGTLLDCSELLVSDDEREDPCSRNGRRKEVRTTTTWTASVRRPILIRGISKINQAFEFEVEIVHETEGAKRFERRRLGLLLFGDRFLFAEYQKSTKLLNLRLRL